MFTEPEVYSMLMRSRSKSTEPFRKWVTEEVLPSIRKAGSYDADKSASPIAVGVMDELKALRGEVFELKALIQGMSLSGRVEVVKSPEGPV